MSNYKTIYSLHFTKKLHRMKLDKLSNLNKYNQNALNWEIFVYPTDTIYWLWAIINETTLEKIYDIKQRDPEKPVSIIAPNVEWILENFICPPDFENIIKGYRQKYWWYTLFLEKKDNKFLKGIWRYWEWSKNMLVWVRLIDHPFQQFVEQLDQPFITTSLNISWYPHCKRIKDIPQEIESKVDIIIDWWDLLWAQSTLINPMSDFLKIRD